MTDHDLEQIRALLRDALGPMEGDLAAVRTDVAALKTDVAVLKTDVAVLKTDVAVLKTDVAAQGAALAAVRADVDAQGAVLGAVRTDVDAIKIDVAAQGAALTALRTEVNAIKTEISGWPDLHFLQAMAQQQIREADEAREARRYMEIKLDEIYSSMATSSEIKRLRDEVSESLNRERLLDLRISAIEMRLGIKNPLAPTE
jgi:chromosome segregation ATPase